MYKCIYIHTASSSHSSSNQSSIHSSMHTCIQVCILKQQSLSIHSSMHACIQVCMHIFTHMHTASSSNSFGNQSGIHSSMHIHVCSFTYMNSHTRTQLRQVTEAANKVRAAQESARQCSNAVRQEEEKLKQVNAQVTHVCVYACICTYTHICVHICVSSVFKCCQARKRKAQTGQCIGSPRVRVCM